MGMFNYQRKFIPDLAEISSPLRQLLKGKVEFQWLQIHSDIVDKLKSLISSDPNFDFTKPLVIQCDASQNGLQFCLIQGDKPVCFGSSSMSNTQKRYSQIDKELLSIVSAVSKCHNYIYGKESKIVTDHKPLVKQFKKGVTNIKSSQLQWIVLKSLKYDLSVSYLPGKLMFIADLLSRSFTKNSFYNDDCISEVVHSITTQGQLSDERKTEFQNCIVEDPLLNKVIQFHLIGWPN